MKIVVVSDSHGSFESLYKILKSHNDCDMFIHLGDGKKEYDELYYTFGIKECRFVKGNNDFDAGLSVDSQVFESEGHRFFITHGHNFYVRARTDGLISIAKANNCGIALFGHTHIRFNQKIDNVQLFNPGSCFIPRDGQAPSFGIIAIEKDKISFKHCELNT